VLSGKHTRASAGKGTVDRAALVSSSLNETTYKLIDELEVIAKAHNSTVARVSLAWLRTRAGVTSTIIGARRIGQLEDNLKSLELVLTADEVAHLDALTKPVFGFPQSMQPRFASIHNGGTSVNGTHAPISPFGLQQGEKPY
jgi:aryl-alcohol dehydrogenase-like predicted oxidoreductase